ncbi:MAG: hypothetical protein KGL70_13705 [Betaproteobacteria bacterium]|nr:hypothetical protein [Betaproteobacteria bacterium]
MNMNASKFLVSSAAAIALVGAVSFAYAQTDNQSAPMPNATTAQTPAAVPVTDTTTQPPAASPMTDTTTAQRPAASPTTDATTRNSMPSSGRDTAMRSTERPAKADRH